MRGQRIAAIKFLIDLQDRRPTDRLRFSERWPRILDFWDDRETRPNPVELTPKCSSGKIGTLFETSMPAAAKKMTNRKVDKLVVIR